MKRVSQLGLCLFLFGVGWAIGAEEGPAAGWNSLTTVERLIYADGYFQGYFRGTLDGSIIGAALLRQKNSVSDAPIIEPAKLARLQTVMRDQIHTGTNQHVSTAKIEQGMDMFYSDFRNQAVCWHNSYRFSAMALNGDTPTEQELETARKIGAKSGCTSPLD
jgi:hypothetical protein